jgi:glycosyltransferase involved in cell wall biosynthesis
MRILITNNRLHGSGGTETELRLLAGALEALGHSVLVFTCDPVPRPRPARRDELPISVDLEKLRVPPDLIHAQHHLDALTALASLPGVPAIYHCHGATWRDVVPRHPRLYHYVAVSSTLRERIGVEFSIPETDITVVLNGVDVERFRPRRTPARRPVRALFYNGRHDAEGPTVRAVRDAVAGRGLGIDFIGARFGRTTDEPEAVLPGYDLVFASGVSALEALACGCAVVVLGRTSCGELVTPGNFDRYRGANFTVAVNSPEPCAEAIARELDRYRPEDVAEVGARVRSVASGHRMVETLVPIYRQVIARHQAMARDPRAELLAMSRYLRSLVPLVRITDGLEARREAVGAGREAADACGRGSATVAAAVPGYHSSAIVPPSS